MVKFTTPKLLNGSQLKKELNAAGISISDDVNSVELDGNGDLWLAIDEKDKTKAKTIVDAHIGTSQVLTIEEKLEIVGLSLDELKAAIAG